MSVSAWMFADITVVEAAGREPAARLPMTFEPGTGTLPGPRRTEGLTYWWLLLRDDLEGVRLAAARLRRTRISSILQLVERECR